MSRRVIAVIAAVLIGIAGTTVVALYANAADRRALAGQQAVSVFVVHETVPAGTTAADARARGLIATELIARKAVPEGALTEVDQNNGSLVATAALQPGALVMAASFAARAATPGSLAVPSGKLAVTVALDDPGHVGPFLTVGAHVVVFDTFNVRPSANGAQVPDGAHLRDDEDTTRTTRVVLPDVEVLAVGATTTAVTPEDGEQADGSKETQPGQALLVTLAVDQAQAEQLIHVSRTGTPTFALLGPDASATAGPGIDDTRLFGEAKP